MNALSENCKREMKQFTTVLKGVCEKLFDGTITLPDLKIVAAEKNHFKSILSAMKNLPVDLYLVMASLTLRQKQLNAFVEDMSTVQHFIDICENCEGNIDILAAKVREYTSKNSVEIKVLCEEAKVIDNTENYKRVLYVHLADTDQFVALEQYHPKVTAFQLSSEDMKICREIKLYTSPGPCFTRILVEKGKLEKESKGQKLNVDEVLRNVWVPTREFWHDLCNKLKTGELLFSEFEKNFTAGTSDTLRAELKQIFQNTKKNSWIEERLRQFKQYKDICSYSKGAKTILKVVEAYDIKGDFQQIKDIMSLTENADTKMGTLDDSLWKTCTILHEIDDKKAACLAVFISCKDLILWLRETMSSIRDLPVFVDLAYISAGEGDMAVARVECLRSATTGYAQLIFNFHNTCDCSGFLKKCSDVWKELKTDPKLPEKLQRTCESLEWLKSVEKTHGSVEVNSLSQAKHINANGVYEVGKCKPRETQQKMTLEDVLDLSVTPDREKKDEIKTEKLNYNYQQLKELQSKLMLVAGKADAGKDEVDRFIMILDAVVRLGIIYTKLVSDGCVLFSDWHATFLCDKNRPACIFITFCSGEEAQSLRGKINQHDTDVSSVIPKVAKFLENCHEEWLEYINLKRKEYYSLNYYTIDQIVILQKELVRVTMDQDPSVNVYPLLSAVKKNCTKEDLLKALSLAKLDVDRLNSVPIEEDLPMDVQELEIDERAEAFIKVMTESDFPEELAKRALQHCSVDDIEEGLVWCENNEGGKSHDTQEISAEADDSEEMADMPYTGWIHSNQSLASVTTGLVHQLDVGQEQNAFEKLHSALKELWEKFVNSISSSVSDYISVEHLGLILNRLAEREKVTVERMFSRYFKQGEPNLVICPQSKIIFI